MRYAILLFLPFFLMARENPFLPATEYIMDGNPTKIEQDIEFFDQQVVALPSSARVLKYVVFEYQSLDGDTKELRVPIDKKVDWHDPMLITKESLMLQSLQPSPPNEPMQESVKAEVDVEVSPNVAPASLDEQNFSQIVTTQTIVKEQYPKSTNSVGVNEKVRQVDFTHEKIEEKKDIVKEFLNYISFEFTANSIFVKNEDELIRNFMVANPYKIVLDFKRDTGFYTTVLPVDFGSFKDITMGNHQGHYRAVILLDGYYRYGLKKVDGGYEIKLR